MTFAGAASNTHGTKVAPTALKEHSKSRAIMVCPFRQISLGADSEGVALGSSEVSPSGWHYELPGGLMLLPKA